LEEILEDPVSYGKTQKIVKFKTKCSEELNSKELPPTQKHARLEIKVTEYAKLFMMNNPIHDHDREKASSIVENIKINKNVLLINPYFQNSKWGVILKENEIKLGMKELYR
jgi:hypothetical protein